MTAMQQHSLRRTSPTGKGERFVGVCVLCGKAELSAKAALEYCENPDETSWEATMLDAVRNDDEQRS